MTARMHRAAAVSWVTVGGLITWLQPDAVWWVAIMSLYANVVGHWSGAEAAAAKELEERRDSDPRGHR